MNSDDVSEFERVQTQLEAMYNEIGTLSKKTPDGPINKFKLKLINQILDDANTILGDDYKPFPDFTHFDENELPSNSDVVVILAQYLGGLESLRCDNIERKLRNWYWVLDDEGELIETGPPRKLNY